MSRVKTTLAAALSATVLSGCGTCPTPFPEAPALLMREPARLSDIPLKENPLLSDVAEQHAREATLFHAVRAQLIALQDWVRRTAAADK